MKKTKRLIFFIALMVCIDIMGAGEFHAMAQNKPATSKPVVKKILFIGDSMTGWLSERLGAWGKENGFDVGTIVWDGSTIKKWGTNPKFAKYVAEYNPDAIFISLGGNDLYEKNPDRQKGWMDAIKGVAGNRPIIWVGPPSWPGHGTGEVISNWIAKQVGEGHFFKSNELDIPRQSGGNIHSTRAGAMDWMDTVIEWIRTKGAISLPGYKKPTGEQMSRGKMFIYKRVKETL